MKNKKEKNSDCPAQSMRLLSTISLLVLCNIAACDNNDSGCLAGDWILCEGPNNCSGIQICKDNGSGFGDCDCNWGTQEDNTDTNQEPDTNQESDTETGGSTGNDTDLKSLYPLAVGNSWTYSVIKISETPYCELENITEEVLSKHPDIDAYEKKFGCNNSEKGIFVINDGTRVYPIDNPEDIVLELPLRIGHTWTRQYGECSWHSHGPMETPAGVFPDCWTVEKPSNQYLTYCRGVGLVKTTGSSSYDTILIDYDIKNSF